MKKLIVYLKGYIKESVLAPLFKLLEASFELIVPLVIASIIDKGIANRDVRYIVGRCAILVLLALVGMLAAITAQYFAARAATGFGRKVRHALYSKIQSLSFYELDRLGTSSLITRMTNDVTQVQNCVNMVLRLFLRSPFIVFGAMIMAFFIDVQCASIFAVAIALLSLVVFGIMAYTIPRYKQVQAALDDITLSTRENIEGARVIRAFVSEDSEKQVFNRKVSFLSKLQNFVGRISALLNPVTYVIINIAIVILIYSGAVKVNIGVLTQGKVVALYNYISQILVELIKLANLIVLITKAFACGDRITKVLEEQNTLEHIVDNTKYKDYITFDNVSLKYGGASDNSLNNISFTAERGDVIGIIGGTGSGKSSLAALVGHFYDASYGVVAVDGKNVKSYNDSELKRKLGFVFQKAVLFKGTVRDNMKYSKPDATDDEIIEALKQAEIYASVTEKDGLDTVIEQNGANLSGGQRQRLTIARALVRKPEILVLDDSFSALDFATEAKLRETIYSLDYNPTVFIISQRASSVMGADKIIVLDNGECVGLGTHKQLLDSCVIYQEIYSSQFGKEDEYEQ